MAIDALPGKTFAGVVTSISPVNDSSSTSVSYPVTIELADDDLTGVKPGMNAVATLTGSTELSADSWLVPTNALQTTGAATVVTVIRDQQTITVTVTPGSVQGEYAIVESPARRTTGSWAAWPRSPTNRAALPAALPMAAQAP